MPPAFILSQDQTLHYEKFERIPEGMPCSFIITSQGGVTASALSPKERACTVTDNSIHRDNRTIFRCSVAKELFLPQVRRDITLSELSPFASPVRTFFGNSVWIKRKVFRPSYLL